MSKKSLSVPKNMQATYDAIVASTDSVCRQHLNEEYAELARLATAALCRKRPSPLLSGKPATWACGVVHALGFVNSLFDRGNEPHLSVEELCGAFGVGKSTGPAKSKQVRDALGFSQRDPDWTLPSMLEQNPRAWLILVDGFIIDARSAPREIQEVAYRKGLIPYIPEEEKPAEAPPVKSPQQSSSRQQSLAQPQSVYQLKVTLKDVKPPIWRRIQVAADTPLDELHAILQAVMGWTDSHLHQFITGRRPDLTFYTSADVIEEDMGSMEQENECEYTLEHIAPEEKNKFVYEYDFGDCWEHEILVEKILPSDAKTHYPYCLTGKRACPPEDVGGVGGYMDFLEALKDPDDPDHEDMLEWVGDDFDSESFDAAEVNHILKKMR